MARHSKVDEASEYILGKIHTGEIRPGSLQSENELADAIGVSRTTVKSAVAALESTGLVRREPQVGFWVREFTQRDLDEIFDARLFLEPTSAALLAERCPDSGLADLEVCIHGMEMARNADDLVEFLKHDVRFHQLIPQLAERELYSRWSSDIGEWIRAIGFRFSPSTEWTEWMNQVIGEHRDILSAVLSGDSSIARSTAQAHLKRTRDRLRDV